MNNNGELLRDAFEIVRQANTEIATLLIDLEDEILKGIGSNNLYKIHTGNEIGTESSNSLRRSDRWIKQYITRYFQFNSRKFDKNWYGGIGISYFFDCHAKSITPKLFLGIFQKKNIIKPFNTYFWLPASYSSELEMFCSFFDSKEVILRTQLPSDIWLTIIPNKDDPKYSQTWFDSSYLYIKELTEIDSKDKVKLLADEYLSFVQNLNLY